MLNDTTIADTTRGYRVLETSHPPNYYFPPEDIAERALERTKGTSFCEFKGRAHYFNVKAGSSVATEAAWAYDSPSDAFAPIAGYVAFYASRMDECYVDDELVTSQPGGFYGGWITEDIAGPYKGGPAVEVGRQHTKVHRRARGLLDQARHAAVGEDLAAGLTRGAVHDLV